MDFTLAKKEDSLLIALIHQKELTKGFLSSLGPKSLSKFYEAIITSESAFCFVAKEEGQVVGFISGVIDMKKFQKDFLKRYFFVFLPLLVPKMVEVSNVKKIIENLLYPKKTQDLPAAELFTIATKSKFQGRGIGNNLLKSFIKEMKKRKISVFKVLVGKDLPAVKFYQKNNFELFGEITVHGDEKSFIFLYHIA